MHIMSYIKQCLWGHMVGKGRKLVFCFQWLDLQGIFMPIDTRVNETDCIISMDDVHQLRHQLKGEEEIWIITQPGIKIVIVIREMLAKQSGCVGQHIPAGSVILTVWVTIGDDQFLCH